jgi:histidinol-phosphate/aromatic aminotransferase/cobyric acid decarboxylase-like protein
MEKDRYTFAKEHGFKEHQITDVSAGICPLGPSKKVKTAIRKAVRNLDVYPDPDSAGLRKFFRSKFAITDQSLLFANSLGEILSLIAAVCRPRRILVAGPAPDIYRDALSGSGAAVGQVTGDKPGFEAGMEWIGRHMEEVDLLVVARPNRITGRLIERKDIANIIESASERKALIIVDESLIEFTADEGLLAESPNRENLIVLRTTANYYGLPGLELAYAVASPVLTAKLSRQRRSPVNLLAAEAAKTAYKDKTYHKLAKEFMEKEKRLIAGALKKLDRITFHETDSNVFLVRLDCPERNVPADLARAGFLVGDCSNIEGLGADYLRLSVMSHDRNLKLLRILKERCP